MAYQRDYKREYRDHGGTEGQKKRRAGRNKARREAIRAGKVKKGDGKEIDHINFRPTDNRPSNLRVVSATENRKRQPKRK